MRVAIEGALKRRVLVGAHPGYADRAGFGRRETGDTPAQIRASTVEQLGAFAEACADVGANFTHVKPHGALYNRAMVEPPAAEAIARAVRETDASLIVLCMPGSALQRAADDAGLRVAREAFLDRAYRSPTELVSRASPGAIVTDPAAAAQNAARMVIDRVVISIDGTAYSIDPDSLCVHGDNPDAVALLREARALLQSSGVKIVPFALG